MFRFAKGTALAVVYSLVWWVQASSGRKAEARHRDCHSKLRTSSLMGKIKTLKRSIATLLEIKVQQDDCLQIKVLKKSLTIIGYINGYLENQVLLKRQN